MPSVGLPGVNDATCTSDDPPVLLLHGTVSSPAGNFRRIAAQLVADGHCVYALTYGERYGFGGLAPIRDSADEVSAFAARVLAVAGADQLDIVGYSQGALVARTMLADGGLDPAAVRSLVMIAPSFHGTTSAIATNIPARLCAACVDQAAGSTLLQELATTPELVGDVQYAVISTRNDLVVTPVSSQVPIGPADRVRSLIIEDHCDVVTDHVELVHEPAVARWVSAAVASGGRPTPSDLGCD